MEDLKQAIIDKTKEVIALARQKFQGYAYAPMPSIVFTELGKQAGRAYGSYRLEYNLTVFASDPERFINETIPHEIAHTVCFHTGMDKGHGRNWKAVCRMLGGNAQRCYTAQNIEFKHKRKVTEYLHIGKCGTEVWVSKQRHNAMMKDGREYRVTATKSPINASTYANKSKTSQ